MKDLASQLRHRVTIKAQAAGQDAAGQPNGAWSAITGGTDIAAGIRFLSGVESMKAGEMVSVGKVSFVVRWRTDVTAGQRVYHGSTVYEITSVQPDMERRDRVYLVCETINVNA